MAAPAFSALISAADLSVPFIQHEERQEQTLIPILLPELDLIC
jgi:hypothetical protein